MLVGAEARVVEAAVGRGDDPHIDRPVAVRADRTDPALLEDAQQGGLLVGASTPWTTVMKRARSARRPPRSGASCVWSNRDAKEWSSSTADRCRDG